MSLSRRDFLKSSAAASAAAAMGMAVPADLQAQAQAAEGGWRWDKAACRFCGTGCGIMLATKEGKIVAVKGDPAAPVNRGLNCIKGYFNAKIMYGADRLKQPLLRMNAKGEFDKQGDFAPVSWKRAFDEMEIHIKSALKEKGPEGIGIFASGQYTVMEGYAALKMMKGGFRSNAFDPNARHCMASAVVGFYQTFGIDEPSGCYDDIELTDTVVTWGSNMAEMHPTQSFGCGLFCLATNQIAQTGLSSLPPVIYYSEQLFRVRGGNIAPLLTPRGCRCNALRLLHPTSFLFCLLATG